MYTHTFTIARICKCCTEHVTGVISKYSHTGHLQPQLQPNKADNPS